VVIAFPTSATLCTRLAGTAKQAHREAQKPGEPGNRA